MTLKNVQIVDKGERSKFTDKDTFDKSSDIRVYNFYQQDWQTLVDEGLSHLFNDDKAEFEYRKGLYEMGVTGNATEHTQTNAG